LVLVPSGFFLPFSLPLPCNNISKEAIHTGIRTSIIKVRCSNKIKHQAQIMTTNKFEALQHAETEGNTKHERKDPAPPLIFVPGITNMQRLTATIEQVVNRLNYTLKIISNNIIKIITNKVEYHKTIIDILKEKNV
jgi:hypothetical protein